MKAYGLNVGDYAITKNSSGKENINKVGGVVMGMQDTVAILHDGRIYRAYPLSELKRLTGEDISDFGAYLTLDLIYNNKNI